MSFKESLLQLLKTDIRLLDSEGELMGNKIQDLADKIDEKLIALLLDNPETRAKFFLQIKDVYVFKTADFKFYIDENKIDNSYTQYENRIGLTSKGKFLKDSNDVVLDFPYKDCVLEGGQSTEEGTDTYFEWDEKDQHYTEKQAKRKEIFFNSVLAKDEIDRLLEPKAFTNAKRYAASESSTDKSRLVHPFSRDENGTIKDNLIIKGNNLLALHTLKKEFAGKVKLIYIDPPYNTGNDSFAYNDNFNHSTWLTFMRNRLLVAKELLREDGSIWINLDVSESHYGKILCDGIFGRDNFINDLIWHHTIQAKNDTKGISLHHNSILIYRKTNSFDLKKVERTDENNLNYKNPDNDIRGKWRSGDVRSPSLAKSLIYKIKTPNGNIIEPPEYGWRWNKNTLNDKIDTGEIIFNKEETRITRKIYLEDQGGRVIESIWFAKDVGTSREGTNEIKELFGDKIFSTPKPEKLLHRIINIASSKNDIVLDYHLGSGTTAAVAHKMNRQYIGIEQMDYVETVALERLKKVIDGEQGGISKSVNWQGGGSFVYLELAKNNQNAVEQIQNCTNYEELALFFDEMCEKYFLHYNVKVKQFKEEVSKEENFKKLALNKQKELFIKMLDLNQLYVNVSDMEDKKHNLSDDDIAITKDFYQL